MSFHGGLTTLEGQDYTAADGPILLLHGTADPVSGPAELAEVVSQMLEAGVEHDAELYGGARHAFTVWGTDDYQLEADRASWGALQAFLEESV